MGQQLSCLLGKQGLSLNRTVELAHFLSTTPPPSIFMATRSSFKRSQFTKEALLKAFTRKILLPNLHKYLSSRDANTTHSLQHCSLAFMHSPGGEHFFLHTTVESCKGGRGNKQVIIVRLPPPSQAATNRHSRGLLIHVIAALVGQEQCATSFTDGGNEIIS